MYVSLNFYVRTGIEQLGYVYIFVKFLNPFPKIAMDLYNSLLARMIWQSLNYSGRVIAGTNQLFLRHCTPIGR